MRQIESLQIVPIVPENREDVSKAPKVSSISAESTMSVVFAEVVTKLLPYLQRIIDIAEHKHVCKHASQLPRHLAGYSLSGQVNPKLVGGNETTSNTCFLKSVMNNAIQDRHTQLHQKRGEEEGADEPFMDAGANTDQP